MPTGVLANAKRIKADEFYTQLSDIEKELKNYKKHFRGKIIFCNCDDPEYSNFYYYFISNFDELGLRKLITTHFEIDKASYMLEYEGGADVKGNKDRVVKNAIKLGKKLKLKQNFQQGMQGDLFQTEPARSFSGDFRSPECIELLKQSDIIVTNPPFSLFREYIAQLMKFNKKFIIIGNSNAISYKEIFKFIKENKIWIGPSIHSGDREFQVPKSYPLNAASSRVDDNGNRFIRVKGVRWFTNLDFKARHENLPLYKNYNKNDYPKYNNYNAINVDITKEIPCDYNGVMGVPITFIDKYNPEQFEIIALGNSRDNFTPNKDYINPKKVLKDGKIVNGGAINCVLVIETDKKPKGEIYYTSDNSHYLIAPYARILIKNKHPIKGAKK